MVVVSLSLMLSRCFTALLFERRDGVDCIWVGSVYVSSWAWNAAFSRLSMAEETALMTSNDWVFERGFGPKIEEKADSEDAGGKEVVTDIGR